MMNMDPTSDGIIKKTELLLFFVFFPPTFDASGILLCIKLPDK